MWLKYSFLSLLSASFCCAFACQPHYLLLQTLFTWAFSNLSLATQDRTLGFVVFPWPHGLGRYCFPEDGAPLLSMSPTLWPERQDLLTEGEWETLLARNKQHSYHITVNIQKHPVEVVF